MRYYCHSLCKYMYSHHPSIPLSIPTFFSTSFSSNGALAITLQDRTDREENSEKRKTQTESWWETIYKKKKVNQYKVLAVGKIGTTVVYSFSFPLALCLIFSFLSIFSFCFWLLQMLARGFVVNWGFHYELWPCLAYRSTNH